MTAMRVLIVGPTARRATHVMCRLEGWGCDVCFVENCAEALRMLKSDPFDFVLSQLMLPDGSADQLLSLLQSTRTHVFFNLAFTNDCWWLHVLDGGQNRWWEPTLLPPEDFLVYIERDNQREFTETRPANGTSSFQNPEVVL
jgi:response regulator RpfG family c-di-GMP phosphodiesterase